MQEFKMPYRELRERFTISEIAIMSWSSKEQMLRLERPRKEKIQLPEPDEFEVRKDLVLRDEPEKTEAELEMENMDMRQIKGRDAYKIFASQGLKFPIIKKF